MDTLESDYVQKVADDYRARGYEVLLEPGPEQLPAGLAELGPDMVAVRDGDHVIIELKRSGRGGHSLRALAAWAEQHEEWRLDVTMVGPGVFEPDTGQVPRRVAQAQQLLDAGYSEACLLLAWAALEAGLRERAREWDTPREGSAAQVLRGLYAVGALSDGEYERLDAGYWARNAIAHGGTSGEVSEELLGWLCRFAAWLADPTWTSVADMTAWFLDRYEDSVQHVPHDSTEGGYEYVFGGPYDARDVLHRQYPDAPEETIEEAVELLEAESPEWVRKGQY